jgi:23S rRNA pseudouridine1911/1915/1917 synthase
VSDALYGGRPGWGLERQALHALRLELLHPRHREPMRFEAPLPDDLRQAWVAVTGREPAWIDP